MLSAKGLKSKTNDKYGITFAPGLTDADIELRIAFDVRPTEFPSLHKASGFLGAFTHLQRAIDLIWNRYEKPLLIWNDWSELMMEELINAYHGINNPSNEIVFTGPSASWKSTCVACFIDCAWLADPLQTKCPISSTNLGSLRELLWKDVYKYWRTSQCGFGNVVQHPKPKIQTVKGDDSMGIFGVAVKQGDTEDVIEQIKGRHAPKVVIGIDEGPGALQAVVDACVNLRTGCQKFLLIMLGNANSQFDQHGQLSEPAEGWDSVTVDSEKWRTKRGGICIHLDGHKAPNVIAGYQKYPGMISQADLDKAKEQYGENSPRYWQERRGFWPPEGLTKTILTASMLDKFHAKDDVIWVGEPIIIAALDPAFEGGNRRVLRFAKVGLCDSTVDGVHIHHRVLCPTETLCLKVDVTSKEPIHYQIARQTREECKARGVEPEDFAMDSSGEGGGVAAIFKREWSEDIIEVEFGGYPDKDRSVSDINPRAWASEVVNKVTQLWMQVRTAVERNQIRGMDFQTAKEFCQRKVDYERYAPRSIVQSKKEMNDLIGGSPDFSDCFALLVELCLRRGYLPSSTVISGRTRTDSWQSWAREMVPLSRYATT